MIEFPRTAYATAHAKKLCKDAGIAVRAVNSRWIADQAQFRTTVLPQEQNYETTTRLITVLREAGFRDIVTARRPHDIVTAYSTLTGTAISREGELARRALVDRLPESYSADEVSAMSDDEAIAVAASCGLMGG